MNRLTYTGTVLAALGAIATQGCTSLRSPAMVSAPKHHSHSAAYVIAQLGFGDGARYGLCLPPACPAVTPKSATAKDNLSRAAPADPFEHAPAIKRNPSSLENPSLNLLAVYFRPGESTLNSDARHAIDRFVTSMPAVRIRIAARTDSTGSPARNGRIALQRAKNVARYLESLPATKGIDVEFDAAPLCCYVADNADAKGRRLNRRVDITLMAPDRMGAL